MGSTMLCVIQLWRLGPLIGVPIAGAIIGASDCAYWGVAVFTGLCYCFAMVCFVAIRVAIVS